MTIVRIVSYRRPRRCRLHGRLTLAVTTPHGHPTTITIPGGSRADVTGHLHRRFGITDWRFAR